MSLQLGQTAPDFTAESSQDTIHFHDWAKGKWTVFFSHPKDFTPICTTELGQFAKRKAEFDQPVGHRHGAVVFGSETGSY